MSGLHAKHIVVPVDFSDISFEAVDRALEIVDDAGTVDIIHVLSILPAMDVGNLYGGVPDEGRIESVKNSLRERLSDTKYAATTIHVAIGDPGHEIAEFAKKSSANLIVLPSHGYGFVKHIVLGSVAERVIRFAHCPVLVLRA